MNRRALTLVEVLVVAGIVAVLFGLTFTLGPRAMDFAKDRSCASNLSQIGKGIALYAADHDDAFPSAPLTSPSGGIAFKAGMAEYGVADSQFYCPRDPYARTKRLAEFGTHEHTSYTYGNLFILMVVNGSRGGIIRLTGPTLPPWLPPVEPSDFHLLTDHGWPAIGPDGEKKRTSAHGARWNVLRHDLSVANLPVYAP